MATASIAELRASQQKTNLAEMKPKEQISYLLKSKQGEIAKMLPKHLNAERLLKVAQIAATTTPALAKCDVASLVGAIGQCAQMGLEPNTVLGHAYLVPFNTKRKDANGNERWVNSVQVIIGYKGLIELARRSGQIVSIAAHEVCAKDTFDLVYGLDEKLEHRPAMNERGDVIGFYAVAKLKDGGHAFEFMSTHQIHEIRNASQGYQQAVKYKKQDAHPWTVHFIEMGRKTVIRRLAKYLPLSIEFQAAAALDGLAEAGQDQHPETFDGDFTLVPDDAPQGDDGFDADEESLRQIEHQRPAVDIPPVTGTRAEPEPAAQQTAAQTQQQEQAEHPGVTEQSVLASLKRAQDTDTLDTAADLISAVEDDDAQQRLTEFYTVRRQQLTEPQEQKPQRRPRQSGLAME